MCDPRAHDFVWISDRSALQSDDVLPAWVNTGWRTALPLVVRRVLTAQSRWVFAG